MARSRILTNYHLPSVFHEGNNLSIEDRNGASRTCPPAALFMSPPPISQFAQLDPNHLAVSAPSVIIFLPLPVAVMCIVPLIRSWSTAMISPVPESFAPISRYSLGPWYWWTPAVVQVSHNCRYPTIGKVSVGLHACETVRSQNEVTLLRWAPVEK